MGTVPLPDFNKDLALEYVVSFFRSFFENDHRARLTDLEVSFNRIVEYDRGETSDIRFPIRIRRSERDDTPNPIEGGLAIIPSNEWIAA